MNTDLRTSSMAALRQIEQIQDSHDTGRGSEIHLRSDSEGSCAYKAVALKSASSFGRIASFFSRSEFQKKANQFTIAQVKEDIKNAFGDEVAGAFESKFFLRKFFGSPLTKGALMTFLEEKKLTLNSEAEVPLKPEINTPSSLLSNRKNAAACYGNAAQAQKEGAWKEARAWERAATHYESATNLEKEGEATKTEPYITEGASFKKAGQLFQKAVIARKADDTLTADSYTAQAKQTYHEADVAVQTRRGSPKKADRSMTEARKAQNDALRSVRLARFKVDK